MYGWEYGRIIICGVCYRWDGSGSIGSGGYTLVREKGIDMTDLHEQTKKEIGIRWEDAHRQRCEELEKLQKENEMLRCEGLNEGVSYFFRKLTSHDAEEYIGENEPTAIPYFGKLLTKAHELLESQKYEENRILEGLYRDFQKENSKLRKGIEEIAESIKNELVVAKTEGDKGSQPARTAYLLLYPIEKKLRSLVKKVE